MRRRALNLLRSALHYRRAAFEAGLRRAGYEVVRELKRPGAGDVLVIWNRYSGNDELAGVWERAGADVIVVENGWFGKQWTGGDWFSLSRGHHGAGWRADGGPARWDSLGASLAPWTTATAGDVLILQQRGIGEPNLRSPDHWAESIRGRVGGRIRPHPGKAQQSALPLDRDLEGVRCVLTWNSSAALLALAAGVPVFHAQPAWIGAAAAKPLAAFLAGEEPLRDDAARLGMFRRLAWSMWTLKEIEAGAPFGELS